jgi:hypothetical protein
VPEIPIEFAWYRYAQGTQLGYGVNQAAALGSLLRDLDATCDSDPKNPLEYTSGLSQIGSDQMHDKAEYPLVPQCKFGALTNSQRHQGTLFDAVLVAS